jgi:hypothetical protein
MSEVYCVRLCLSVLLGQMFSWESIGGPVKVVLCSRCYDYDRAVVVRIVISFQVWAALVRGGSTGGGGSEGVMVGACFRGHITKQC